jgi:hypothetical protein
MITKFFKIIDKFQELTQLLVSRLPVQSVPITTKVVSSNPVHGEVYSIQHYVIMFASDLRQVGGSLQFSGSSTNKTAGFEISGRPLAICE